MKEVKKIPIDKIDSFENHPFMVRDDESIKELVISIKENGLLNPIIVREKENDRFEMISGHRRKKACEMLGMKEMDGFIKKLSNEEATIFMVDSNMYREKIYPSEKAYAYKMKYEAIKHQGKKTMCHDGTKLRSDEKLAKKMNDSARQIHRYINLTNLIPELLKLVDNAIDHDKRTVLSMGLLPAVELSFLSKEEQMLVYSSITYNDSTPSHEQARMIRKMSKEKKLNYNILEELLSQAKASQLERISFNKNNILSVLPIDMRKRNKKYIEQYIIKAIKSYKNSEEETQYENEWSELEQKLK